MKTKESGGKRIGCCLIAILALPLLLPLILCVILYTPLDYIRFRRCGLWKKEGVKYSLLAGFTEEYKIYRAKEKYAPEIEYYKGKEGDGHGSFLYRGRLILFDLGAASAHLNEEGELCALANGEDRPLSEALKTHCERFESQHKLRPTDAYILMRRGGFENPETEEKAEASGHFILYKRGRIGEALADFSSRIDG